MPVDGLYTRHGTAKVTYQSRTRTALRGKHRLATALTFHRPVVSRTATVHSAYVTAARLLDSLPPTDVTLHLQATTEDVY